MNAALSCPTYASPCIGQILMVWRWGQRSFLNPSNCCRRSIPNCRRSCTQYHPTASSRNHSILFPRCPHLHTTLYPWWATPWATPWEMPWAMPWSLTCPFPYQTAQPDLQGDLHPEGTDRHLCQETPRRGRSGSSSCLRPSSYLPAY